MKRLIYKFVGATLGAIVGGCSKSPVEVLSEDVFENKEAHIPMDVAPVYGPPPRPILLETFQGTVLDAESKKPIEGIKVSANSISVVSDENGKWSLSLSNPTVVKFEDIDGPLNGTYSEQELDLVKDMNVELKQEKP